MKQRVIYRDEKDVSNDRCSNAPAASEIKFRLERRSRIVPGLQILERLWSLVLAGGRVKSVRDRRATGKSMAGIGRADTRGINLPSARARARSVLFFIPLPLFFLRYPPTGCAFFLSDVFRSPSSRREYASGPYRSSENKNSSLVRATDKQRSGLGQGYRCESLDVFFTAEPSVDGTLRRADPGFAKRRLRLPISGLANVNIGNRFLSAHERPNVAACGMRRSLSVSFRRGNIRVPVFSSSFR